MTSWDDIYARWSDAVAARRRDEAQAIMREALVQVRSNPDGNWSWCVSALQDADRKWFVARLFHAHPVPGVLFEPMMLACLRDVDASSVKRFVQPLCETFGSKRVADWIDAAAPNGSPEERRFAAMARYWIAPTVPTRRVPKGARRRSGE